MAQSAMPSSLWRTPWTMVSSSESAGEGSITGTPWKLAGRARAHSPASSSGLRFSTMEK